MTIQQIFTGAPKQEWSPVTPWGAAKSASIGKFDLQFVSVTEIEITNARTARQIADCKPGAAFGKIYEHNGIWCASSAAKVGGRGDDAAWAAGVRNFPTLADAIEWLVAA